MTSHKVLIVDDSEFIRRIEKKCLSQIGMEISGEAESGEKAIEKFLNLKPDLIIIDFNLPDINGIEISKIILNYDKNAKIILCSSNRFHKETQNAINSGIKAVISKPFHPQQIQKIAVEVILNK